MINVFLSFGACTVGKTGKIEKIEKKIMRLSPATWLLKS